MRYALYYTPPIRSALHRFGAAFVGYDAYTGEIVPRACLAGVAPSDIEAITGEPRRYGFHATLKAPMRLRSGRSEADLRAEVRQFAAAHASVPVGSLAVTLMGGFVALVPLAPSASLALLAAECVAAFDDWRAPMPAQERLRRADGLSPRQAALLDRWGYPYVFEEFRFHMTLTGRLPPERRQAWLERLREAFGDLGRETVVVDALSLLRQDAPESPFRIVERIPFELPVAP